MLLKGKDNDFQRGEVFLPLLQNLIMYIGRFIRNVQWLPGAVYDIVAAEQITHWTDVFMLKQVPSLKLPNNENGRSLFRPFGAGKYKNFRAESTSNMVLNQVPNH